jgi:hypothetical protein
MFFQFRTNGHIIECQGFIRAGLKGAGAEQWRDFGSVSYSGTVLEYLVLCAAKTAYLLTYKLVNSSGTVIQKGMPNSKQNSEFYKCLFLSAARVSPKYIFCIHRVNQSDSLPPQIDQNGSKFINEN